MIEMVAAPRESLGEANLDLPHILLVLDQLGMTLGGGERIALKLAALLPLHNYRVSILTFAVHSESPALKSPPCPIYLIPLKRTYDLTALRSAFELRKFLRRQRIQIVQTFFESSDIWAGFVTKTMSNAKLIWARRDMGILRTRKHQIAYRLMGGMPDAVFTVSEEVRRHAIEVDRINPDRVQTIYNGLNLDDWNKASGREKPHGRFMVATVGNIRRVKGHDVLIRAASIVVQEFPDVLFSIAGEVLEPAYFTELKTLVQDLNLMNHVCFEGGVINLRQYLSAADVFVLPSRSEGFSNAIVEAMAAFLPIVATCVGGNAEAVDNGINGILVPPDDPNLLAAAVLRLLSDPSRAKAMGKEGRNRAAQQFTSDVMIKRVVSAYGSLLSKG